MIFLFACLYFHSTPSISSFITVTHNFPKYNLIMSQSSLISFIIIKIKAKLLNPALQKRVLVPIIRQAPWHTYVTLVLSNYLQLLKMPASFNPSVLFDKWNGLPLTNPNSFFRTAQMSPSSKILFWWRFYQAIGGVPQLSLKSLFVSLLCFPDSSDSKASSCNAGDPGSIPGLGRSRGEGNGNPVQYFCLENPMYGEAWQAI